MKKLLTTALAVAMAVALAAPVSAAATDLTTSPAQNQAAGEYAIAVNGTYRAADVDEKISVDIAWESMNFTYTEGEASYSPSNHSTTYAAGSWNTDKPAITVKNHSNVAVETTVDFAAENGVTTTGTFYSKSGDTYTALSADEKTVLLESAAGKTRSDADPAADQTPKNTVYFGVSGDGIAANQKLGSVTVKIAKDSRVAVTDEAGLTAALAAGAKIALQNDIALTNTLQLSGGSSTDKTVVDLGGHKLTGKISTSGLKGTLTLTNGTLAYANTAGGMTMDMPLSFSDAGGEVVLKNLTINATGGAVPLYFSGVNVTVDSCTLNGQFTLGTNTMTVWGFNRNTTTTLTLTGTVMLQSRICAQGVNTVLKAGGTYNLLSLIHI